ncbi:MAG: hypothetical protein HQM14_01830 [SAR324 cluster bacterium]|nr:hypothetical protein [SAR324 cluster bacterium]
MNVSRVYNQKNKVSLFLFIMGISFLLLLESWAKPYLLDGLYFQKWTSDEMMQTLPVKSLLEFPIRSLWYLHKQPPGLDLVRGVVVQLVGLMKPDNLLRAVDAFLYKVWMVFGALQIVLIYRWLLLLCGRCSAVLFSLFWMVHPALIYYITLLDGTMLSSLLTSWFFYELWRTQSMKWQIGSMTTNAIRLGIAVGMLMLTRTIFQWFFLPILLFSLLLMKLNRRQIFVFLATASIILGPYFLKQKLVFGILSSATFGGYHLCGIIWYKPSDAELIETGKSIRYSYPNDTRLLPWDTYNTEKQYRDNLVYNKICKEQIMDHPYETMLAIKRSILVSFEKFLKPSSQYRDHALVPRLSWRVIHDSMFSHLSLILIGLSAVVIWLLKVCRLRRNILQNMINGFALSLPFFYAVAIIMLANRYEWVESDRLKFIIEPVFYCFIVTQFHTLFKWLLNFRPKVGL